MDIQTASAADWPQWRGINRDGMSYESGWFTNWPPTEVWKCDVGSNFYTYSSPAVSEGRLYVVGQTRRTGTPPTSNLVYCLNVNNGNTNWTQSFPYLTGYDGEYPGIRATPVVDGTNLYLFTPAGELYCLNKYTGGHIWSKKIDAPVPTYGFCGTPVVENNLILLNMGDGGVAVDKNTHEIVWKNTDGVAAYSSPVVYTATNSQRIVIFRVEGKTVGVNATNGALVWTYSWTVKSGGQGGQASDPIVFGDKMFLTEGGNSASPRCALVQLGTNELTTIWENATGLVSDTSSPVYINGYIYGLSSRFGNRAELRCIDANTGVVKWTNSVHVNVNGSNAEGALIGVDDKLLLYTSNNLYVVKGTNTSYVVLGSLYKTASLSQSMFCFVPPVVSDGRIFVRQGRRVVCYDGVGPTNAPDTDVDGIGDDWEKKYFTNTANCVAATDNDHDGFSNIQEYRAGTDPTNANSYVKLSMTNTNDRLVMSFPTVKAEGTSYFTRARFYSIESSTNLTGNTWSSIPECISVPGTNGSFACTNTISGPPKFYRMKVRLE
jgi:outer membrane protein assembly factor BamB